MPRCAQCTVSVCLFGYAMCQCVRVPEGPSICAAAASHPPPPSGPSRPIEYELDSTVITRARTRFGRERLRAQQSERERV